MADCEALLVAEMSAATECAEEVFGATLFASLSESQRSALVDLAFDMTCDEVRSATALQLAVQNGDFAGAASTVNGYNYCGDNECRCTQNRFCLDACSVEESLDAMSACDTPDDADVCEATAVVDCAWGEWSAWGECSAKCKSSSTARGEETRERSIRVEARNGGAACDGDSEDERSCRVECEQSSDDESADYPGDSTDEKSDDDDDDDAYGGGYGGGGNGDGETDSDEGSVEDNDDAVVAGAALAPEVIGGIVAGSIVALLLVLLIAVKLRPKSDGNALNNEAGYDQRQEAMAVGNPLFNDERQSKHNPLFDDSSAHGSFPELPVGAVPAGASTEVRCEECGSMYESEKKLRAHMKKRHE